MPTQLIPVGTNAATSPDVIVTDTPVTFSLFGAAPPVLPNNVWMFVELKDAGGNYTPIGQINDEAPAVVAAGPATYRLRRPTLRSTQAIGAFSG